MKNESTVVKAIHAGIDELELLLIEVKVFDIDMVVYLQKRFKKLEKLLHKKI